MTPLPRTFALQTATDTMLAIALVGGLLWTVAAVESSGNPVGWLITLSPIVLGAATGRRAAETRLSGAVDGWQSLGGDPRAMLLPLILGAVAVGLLSLLAPVASAAVALPAPITPGPWWSDGWQVGAQARWLVPPGDLPLPSLMSRWWEGAPEGARAGVDGGELLRRASLAAAWPLAVVAGARAPLWGRAVGEGDAMLRGAGWVSLWLVLGALLVGSYSMT